MAGVVPLTRFTNLTEDPMLLLTVNEHGQIEARKVIPAGGHVDLPYREGIDRIGARVTFRLQPAETRPGLPAKEVFPIEVFNHAGVDIEYRLRDGSVSRRHEVGASVVVDFKDGSMLGRVGLVRWFGGLCDSLAAFGNCYSAAADTGQTTVHARGQTSTLTP